MKRELLTLYNIVDLFDEELNYTLSDLDFPQIRKDQIKKAWGLFLNVFYDQTIDYIEDEDIEEFYEDEDTLYENNRTTKYNYTIRTNLDKELKDYCANKDILISTEGPYVTFKGTEEDLSILRDKFFNEFTFDLHKAED